MLYLALAVVCSVGIAVTFKYADRRGMPTFPLFAVNYLIASASAVMGSGGLAAVEFTTTVVSFGMLLGTLFVWSFFLLMLTVRKLGMVIPVALMRLSIVLPVLGSIFIFAERPTLMQGAGILLAFAVLPLASREKLTRATLRPLLQGGLGWGLVLFFSYGVTEFLFKVQKELLPVRDPYDLLVVVFGTALAITVTAAVLRRERFSMPVIGLGIALGLLNLYSTYFFIRALGDLPGIVVYPANGIGIIVLSSLAGVLLWKETLPARNIVALLLAAVALVLLA
jgi:multidrug transporter EmrE-like cation transporter